MRRFNPTFRDANLEILSFAHSTLGLFFPVPIRVEKEKVQYYSELNDLRTSCDHLSNEKVRPRVPACNDTLINAINSFR